MRSLYPIGHQVSIKIILYFRIILRDIRVMYVRVSTEIEYGRAYMDFAYCISALTTRSLVPGPDAWLWCVMHPAPALPVWVSQAASRVLFIRARFGLVSRLFGFLRFALVRYRRRLGR